MPDQARLTVMSAVATYNLIQNLLLPARAYVPANLLASAGLLGLARRYGCSRNELGLDSGNLRDGLLLGSAGAALAGAVALAVGALPSTRSLLLDERAAEHDRRAVLFRSLVRFPLGTALFEEIAFRSVVPAVWRRTGSSPARAATVAAIAFGAWHLIPGRQALAGNPLSSRFGSPRKRATAVLGGAVLTGLSSFGFSWMKERSGSLVAPFMTHAAINSAGYLAGVAAWRSHARS